MSKQDYTTGFLVDQTPNAVFDAINNVRGWWSGEIAGTTHQTRHRVHLPCARRSLLQDADHRIPSWQENPVARPRERYQEGVTVWPLTLA